jgi:protein SCO1/2
MLLPTSPQTDFDPRTTLLALAMLLLAVAAPTLAGAEERAQPLSGFIDDRGHRVDDHTLVRPLRLIVFGYTKCPDVCPLTLAAVHQALGQLGDEAARIDPMFVTVDPERDSVAVLHQYLSAFDDGIRGYRGDEAHLDTFARSLHVLYWREPTGPGPGDYGMSHTATLFLIRRDGRIVARVPHNIDPKALAQSILRAVRDSDR